MPARLNISQCMSHCSLVAFNILSLVYWNYISCIKHLITCLIQSLNLPWHLYFSTVFCPIRSKNIWAKSHFRMPRQLVVCYKQSDRHQVDSGGWNFEGQISINFPTHFARRGQNVADSFKCFFLLNSRKRQSSAWCHIEIGKILNQINCIKI